MGIMWYNFVLKLWHAEMLQIEAALEGITDEFTWAI